MRDGVTKPLWPLVVLGGYASALAVATHLPGNAIPAGFEFSDKLAHGVCYFGLGFLAYFAFESRGWLPRSLAAAVIVGLGTSAFGAVDELVPTR